MRHNMRWGPINQSVRGNLAWTWSSTRRTCIRSLTLRIVSAGWLPASLINVDRKFLHFLTFSIALSVINKNMISSSQLGSNCNAKTGRKAIMGVTDGLPNHPPNTDTEGSGSSKYLCKHKTWVIRPDQWWTRKMVNITGQSLLVTDIRIYLHVQWLTWDNRTHAAVRKAQLVLERAEWTYVAPLHCYLHCSRPQREVELRRWRSHREVARAVASIREPMTLPQVMKPSLRRLQ